MLNPVLLTQMMRSPQAFMQQAMNNSQFMQNPIMRNAMEMYQKGDKEALTELAHNLCKEKGTSFEEMTKQIKSQIGMN